PGRPAPLEPPRRRLVVMPTWLGDCVRATPASAALRRWAPDAQITAVFRPAMAGLAEAMPWIDHVVAQQDGLGRLRAALREARSQGRPDLAVLLPNSFRSAVLPWAARAKHRLGYNRDGRALLLTHRLAPPRQSNGQYKPTPAVDYYLDLIRSVGVPTDQPRLELHPGEDLRAQADDILKNAGLPAYDPRPLALLNPGAQRLDKRWPPERFAQVADHLAKTHNAALAVNGSPREAEVLQAVCDAAATPIVDLSKQGMTLAQLPAVVARASLLITNDTGTRHVAAATGVPVVSLFGPTTLDWTRIPFDHEIALCAGDASTPAPIDHISVEQVAQASEALLANPVPAPADAAP
ncbi:MAG: glycosyltransferase family 9 protein, partial [Planctomycetota bacterium]